MSTATASAELVPLLIRHADDNLIVAQQLADHVTRAPNLEEELAIANIALDQLGVARHLYAYAGEAEGEGRSEDDLAFLRTEREFTNGLLFEQPHADFGELIARQFLIDAYQVELWAALSAIDDERLAGIAAKAAKEARYHLRHSSSWVIRLGDGTDESHRRMQAGVDAMWRFTGELFETEETAGLRPGWEAAVDSVLSEATLAKPEDPYQATGGRSGRHTEHLGHILAEMQWMQRTYPGLEW